MTKKLTTSYVKKEYNRQLKEDYGDDYEFNRWLSSRGEWEGYRMQYLAQKFHTKDVKFKNYMEFGVGPGTWTKMFLNPKKTFTLIDLSSEMIKQAKKNLGERKNINYKVMNILDLKDKEKYDFIFSSRAIKYVPDKEKMFKNLYHSLKKNGTMVIITQSADTLFQKIGRKLKKKEKELLHSEGITIQELKNVLQDVGFKKIDFYPVSLKVNIPKIAKFHSFSNWLWKLNYKKKLNNFSTLLSGSYLIKMRK